MSKCLAVLDSEKITKIQVKAKAQESASKGKRTAVATSKQQPK